jgi:hypothetical protein
MNTFSLNNIEAMNFDKNFITKIEGMAQVNLPRLKNLNLQFNELAEINFTNTSMPALTNLDVRNPLSLN